MISILTGLQVEIEERLKSDEDIVAAPQISIISEVRGDIANALLQAIKKLGTAIVIATPTLRRFGPGEARATIAITVAQLSSTTDKNAPETASAAAVAECVWACLESWQPTGAPWSPITVQSLDSVPAGSVVQYTLAATTVIKL